MATIKSYTDINQSRKLAEILPIESADMLILNNVGESGNVNGTNCTTILKENLNPLADVPKILPCWSLAALLGVLPNNEHIETTISRGSWKIEPIEYLPNIWWCEYQDTKNQTEFNISADNPVDACYEMIIKLYALNLL